MQSKLNIVYHFRVRGTGAEGVHIAGIVNGFRKLGHLVQLVSPTGIDPTNFSDPAKSSNHSLNNTIGKNNKKSESIKKILHKLADILPQFFFEIMELSYNFFAFFKLKKALNIEKVDFFYERYAFFSFAGSLLAASKNIPFVIEVNELSGHKRIRNQCFKSLAKRIEKRIFTKAILIITVSDFLNNEIRQMVGNNTEIVTIPNGVPVEWLEKKPSESKIENLRSKFQIKDKNVICFVGGLVHWHNFDLLLNVFAKIYLDFPNIVLLIVGDGPLKEYIVKKSIELNLPSNTILFVGLVAHKEIPSYISLADIAVIPETNEFRSPIKLFEYMALGIPVVAPRMPAIETIIEHGKDGCLFIPQDSISFKEQLTFILNDPGKAGIIGKNANLKISAEYTWEKHAASILEFLKF